MNQPSITLIEPTPTEFGELEGKVMYDIYSKARTPARALPELHSILSQQGYQNIESIYPKYNSKGVLTRANWKRIKNSDYLLISTITRTRPQSMTLASEYKLLNPKGIVILGGPDATFADKEYLENGSVDYVVRGEGDKTLPELIKTIGIHDHRGVDGISFIDGDEFVRTNNRAVLTPQEFSDLPPVIYDSRTERKMSIPIAITSRGCPYDCIYCSVTDLYGPRYRKKSIDSIIADLKHLRKFSKGKIFIGDDNFAASSSHTRMLLQEMIDNNLNDISYGVQLDVNSVHKEGITDLMKKAGVGMAYVGFEALNTDSLKSIGKTATAKLNEGAAQLLKDSKILVHGMFIVGLDDQDMHDLDYIVEWSKQFCDSAQFFSYIPLPGTKMSAQMEKEGRILTRDFHLYDGLHVIVHPKQFSALELQEKIVDMHSQFYSGSIVDSSHKALRLAMNATARGIIRRIKRADQFKTHKEFLRQL